MRKAHKSVPSQQPGISKSASQADNTLHQLAFDSSVQANLITIVSSGKIIAVNTAACKLLGYSKKALLTKGRTDIFNTTQRGFKNMLKQRKAEGQVRAAVIVFKKNGKQIPSEITSAVFVSDEGIEQAVITITDMSSGILKQKNIDTEKEKIVADNIVLAKSKQKIIDTKKEKIVADNIVIARSKQKIIDRKKEKIVAGNIVIAKTKQQKIDTKKEKIVADNIMLEQAKFDARLSENNEWIKYIAKASYDVMWDWDVATGEIYVGDSIKEVFGYEVQNNIVQFTDFIGCLLAEENDKVNNKLLNTFDTRKKSWNDSFMFKRADGSVATTTSRASIIRDDNGKAVRLIGAIQDMSRLNELERKLEEQVALHNEQNEKLFLAANLSFDVIWDWNLVTNEVFIGEWFEELFGYTIKNNKGDMAADLGKYLHPDDKEIVEKGLEEVIKSSASHWEHAYRFIRADGSIASVFNRASIIRHPGGKAYRMIGAMQDISKQRNLEEKLVEEIATKSKELTEFKENFNLIFNSSSDVLFDTDLVADVATVSDAYEKQFGYKIINNIMPASEWLSHIHSQDKAQLVKNYAAMLLSDATEWNYSFRFLRADDSVANIVTRSMILRNATGKAYREIGSMQDISKQTVLEEKLEHEIKLKERQIVEAMEDAKDTERSDIGKELHDNINQLLSASKMYLEMAKRGGENSKMYLNRSAQYTLEAIEEIRKLTKGLTSDIIKNLGLCEAIDKLTHDTMEVSSIKISCALEGFPEDSINEKFKLNLYRIVQEQLNNILKHARANVVTIGIIQNDDSLVLSISDDGVGFDTAQKRTGIGVDNIKSRATTNNGTASFVSQPGQGCTLIVSFPVARVA